MHWRKDSFQLKELSTCRRRKLHPCLLSFIKVCSKWIKNPYAGPETMKLSKETEKTLQNAGIGKNFIHKTPRSSRNKSKSRYMGFQQLKSFCTAKEWSAEWRDNLQNEKIPVFSDCTPDTRLMTRVYKKLKSTRRNDLIRVNENQGIISCTLGRSWRRWKIMRTSKDVEEREYLDGLAGTLSTALVENWRVFKKLNSTVITRQPCYCHITQGNEAVSQWEVCVSMFTAALLTIAKK